jgi:hypothetical protein
MRKERVMADEEHEGWPLKTEAGDDAANTPVPPLGTEGADSSLVDLFREELKELADAEFVYIPIKGYDRTGLQVKYTMPESGKLLDDIARRVARQYKDNYSRNLYISIDTMIFLCGGVYVQPDGVGEPVMLDPQETGEPCLFDERLAELMGMNGTGGSERAVVKRLFGGNELAINAHAEKLARWLQNTKANVEAELWQLGE